MKRIWRLAIEILEIQISFLDIANLKLLKLQTAVETFVRVLDQQKEEGKQTGKRSAYHRN